MENKGTEVFSGFKFKVQLLSAILRHRSRHPLTHRALLAAMMHFGMRGGSDHLDSYLVVTHEQIRQFLKCGWDYTERQLQLLQIVSAFPPSREGIKRLEDLQQRIEKVNGAPFDKIVTEIYEDPVFPIHQHLGQAFRNQATGRWTFVLDALAELEFPPGRFCDVGCGSGILLGDVLERYPETQGTGIDVSKAVLAHAGRVLQARELGSRPGLILGDIRQLPLPSNHYDFVIALEILEHLPDPQDGIAELARILVPGGWLVSSVPIDNPTPLHIHVFSDVAEVVELHQWARLDIVRQQVQPVAPDVLNAMILARKQQA